MTKYKWLTDNRIALTNWHSDENSNIYLLHCHKVLILNNNNYYGK